MIKMDNNYRLEKYEKSERLYLGDKNVFKDSIYTGEIFKDTKYNYNNPVKIAIDVDLSLMLYMQENGKDINIDMEDKKIKNQIYDFLFNNNFGSLKKSLARDFCLLGDGFLKIYKKDNVIKIKKIDPQYVINLEKNDNDEIIYIKIKYQVNKQDFNYDEYEEEYDLNKFKIIKNGKIEYETENEYGIVPFIHFKNSIGDGLFGESIAITMEEILKTDADLNSICRVVARNFVEPKYWLNATIEEAEETKRNLKGGKRDLTRGAKINFIPKDSKMNKEDPTEIPTSYMNFVNKIDSNIKKMLPELTLDELMQNSNASGNALQTQTLRLQTKITDYQDRFISSFNLFLYYLMIIMYKDKIIKKNPKDIQFTSNFDNFFKITELKSLEETDKAEIKEKIVRIKEQIDKQLSYLNAGIFTKEEVKDNIIKLEQQLKELEDKLIEIRESKKY